MIRIKGKESAEKRKNTLKIFFIVLIFLCAALSIFLFPKGLGREKILHSADEMLYEKYLNESEKIESLSAEYHNFFAIASEDGFIFRDIYGRMLRKGEIRSDFLSISNPDFPSVKARSYRIGEKSFLCAEADAKWNCTEIKTIIPLNEKNVIRINRGLFESGAIIFSEIGKREEKGINCTYFDLDFDIPKLNLEEKYLILASSGLSTVNEPKKAAEQIKSFSMQICETDGIALKSISLLTFKNNLTRKVESEMEHYEINPSIMDSELSLPE